jgi:hypothetical protein
MAKDSWAHLVLMAALERVDDTALLRKYIVKELMVILLSPQLGHCRLGPLHPSGVQVPMHVLPQAKICSGINK